MVREDFKLKIIQESENATSDALSKAIGFEENCFADKYDIRVWRIEKKENLDTLFTYLKKAADRANYQYKIKGFGKRVDPETKLEDLQMEEGDFFVAEVK